MLQSNLTCGGVSGWPLENEWICCGMGVLQAHNLDPVGDKFKGSVAPSDGNVVLDNSMLAAFLAPFEHQALSQWASQPQVPSSTRS